MTPQEFAQAMNALTPEQIAQAMETLPTEVLEFAVKFEALEHKERPR
jgi:predicted Zn-dependent peptidase